VSVARIASVATASPPHDIAQHEAKAVAAAAFAGVDGVERLLEVFDTTGVRNRQLCVEPGWFTEPHSFGERNARWRREAARLACCAASRAVERAGVHRDAIGCVVVVSSTGIATPSLDVDVMQHLGLPASGVAHETIFGRGCAGGAVGLARGRDFAVATPGRAALVVTVELCSLVRDVGDTGPTDLVGAALFADGAAAVVISTAAGGPAIAGTEHVTLPDTHDAMGWDVGDTGLGLILDRNVPALVLRNLAAAVDTACAGWGIGRGEIDEVIAHPGSARVLDAVERALALPAHALDDARAVLADHGNMSAPTVWFVLERTWQRIAAGEAGGTHALLCSMGPGFSIELVHLRW
jgi:alkylresorcinol/alkylpyrone synthase